MSPAHVDNTAAMNAVADPVARQASPTLPVQALHVGIVDSVSGFKALKAAWEHLEQVDMACTPFNTWDWCWQWWEHYGEGEALCLFTVHQGDRLIALLPMYISASRGLGIRHPRVMKYIGWGGDTSPDYLGALTEPSRYQDTLPLLLQALLTHPGWQRLHLSDMLEHSPWHRFVRAGLCDEPGFLSIDAVQTIFHDDLPENWEEYRMRWTRKRRKQVNHRANRLHAAGQSELAIATTPHDINNAIEALITLHRQRWNSKGATGGFVSNAYVNFHRAIILRFHRRNALWLAQLKINGEIIGVMYLYRWRNTLMFFQSGFSPDHEKLSPGHVLFTFVIQQAILAGIKRIDMLKGEYRYKRIYASKEQRTATVVYTRPGIHTVIARFKALLKRQRVSRTETYPGSRAGRRVG